jgi:DNA-binding transcriptional MerR regulator
MSDEPPDTGNRRLVSSGEAARSLGVSARSLARWVQEGLIAPALTTAGGHSRFDVDDLRRQLLAMARRDNRNRENRHRDGEHRDGDRR